MPRPRSLALLAAAAVVASYVALAVPAAASAAAPAAAPPNRAEVAPTVPVKGHRSTGRLVVAYQPGVGSARRAEALRGARVNRSQHVRGVDVDVVTPAGAPAATAARLRRDPAVRYVEAESVYQPYADTVTPELTEIGVPAFAAAGRTETGAGVEIAVIDSAVDDDNPDLTGRVVWPADWDKSTRWSEEDTSLPCTPLTATTEPCAHGTAVATVAAAADGNGHMVGVAPGATIVSYNVFRDDNFGASSVWIANAVKAAVDRSLADPDRKLRVVNMSLGGSFGSRTVEEQIARARANDILVVAAAGNDGGELANYPAGYESVLSVGASGQTSSGSPWVVAPFSNRGDVDVLAPGVNVSLWWQGQVQPEHGTSFAAPMVAGTAALLADAGVYGDVARAAIVSSAEAPNPSAAPAVASGVGRADVVPAYNLAVGTAPFTAAFLARGGQVASGYGRRKVEVLRVDPDPELPNAPATLSTGLGALSAVAHATATVSGKTVMRTTATYAASGHAPGTLGALVANGGAGGDDVISVPLRLLDSADGPEGVPLTASEPARSFPLTHGTRSAYVRTAGMFQNTSAVLEFTSAPDAVDADLMVWFPLCARGSVGCGDGWIADAATEPLTAGATGASDTIVFEMDQPYATNVPGRYAFGWVTFTAQDNGTYGLGVGFPGPTVSLTTPAQLASVQTTAPFTVRWASPNGLGTRKFDVQWTTKRLTSTGLYTYPWKTWRAATTTTSAVFGASSGSPTVIPGETYHFRVRAVDTLDNYTPWVYRSTIVPLNNNSRGLSYSSAWTHVGAGGRWLGNAHYTTTGGRWVSVLADTSSFQVIGDKCTVCGQFRIYLDGVYKGTFDSRATSTRVRQVLWSSGPIPGGVRRHKLQVVAVGTRGRPKIVVDGFAISR